MLKSLVLASALICMPLEAPATAQGTTASASTKAPGVLPADEAQKLMPSAVFFSGQSATTQSRNSGGMRFADGKLSLVSLVDTGGYSTGVREKYQFYLITEAPLVVDGKKIPVGAYGGGFVSGSFLLMDVSGGDIWRVPTTRDAGMQRPRPLQVLAGPSADEFKLYLGREYVAVRRVK